MAVKRGSVAMRWAVALSRRVDVVGGCLEGLVSVVWLVVEGGKAVAVACVPPGVTSVAFVM